MKRFYILIFALVVCLYMSAQQYTGMSGLIHIPSAEMDKEGSVYVGIHYLNKKFTPEYFTFDNKKYDTYSYYVNITPFSWIEIGYTCTAMKVNDSSVDYYGTKAKDRYFSAKIRPIKEKRLIPAVVIGCNDLFDSSSIFNVEDDVSEAFFGNYYIAVSKHINIKDEEIGLHLSYRHFSKDYNSKWNGIVGGITYRPSFCKDLRGIVEYTGNEVNVGADCLLWKHLLLQASLQDGKYISGGVCFQINLF